MDMREELLQMEETAKRESEAADQVYANLLSGLENLKLDNQELSDKEAMAIIMELQGTLHDGALATNKKIANARHAKLVEELDAYGFEITIRDSMTDEEILAIARGRR